MRAVIIDDEKDSVEFISSIIDEYCPDIDVVGTANSVKEGTEVILRKKPDLLFLDVEMPDGTGFNLLENFPQKDFKIIFITAYNHYAIQAIKFSAIDYILKPIHIEEFLAGVKKVKELDIDLGNIQESVSALMENLQASKPVKIAVSTTSGIEYIETDSIVRIEADRCYSTIFLSNKEEIVVSRNLGEFYELLIDKNFSRPHQSHLVNLAFVKKYLRADGGSILMLDGSNIPVSRSKKEIFLSEIGRFVR